MKLNMRDGETLEIIPERTAELLALMDFEGAKVEIEKPRPFESNIDILLVTKRTDEEKGTKE